MKMNRPVESIARLMSEMSPCATPLELPHRRLVEIPTDSIWLVESGMVALYREQGKHLIHIAVSPMILGVRNIFSPSKELLMAEFMGGGAVSRISVEVFTDVLNKKKLWRDLSNMVAFYLETALESNYLLIKRKNYNVIKGLVVEYSLLPDYIKKVTPLIQYIMEKGMLSRSNTMRILSALNRHGCITIKRGRLVRIDCLPEKF